MFELIWDGKYDAQGRRMTSLRLKHPFHTVKTVNESAELRHGRCSAGRGIESGATASSEATRSTCCRRCWMSSLAWN